MTLLRTSAVFLAALAALTPHAAGQMQTSTLVELARRAPLVLRVVVRETSTRGERQRVRLELVETLRGTPPAALVIEELHARHCGSCTHGLARGARLLVFASASKDALRVRGAARGLVHETSERLAVVRKLLALDAGSLAAAVVPLLESSDARIAEDAALALPHLPALEVLDAAAKGNVAAALRRAEKAPSAALYGLVQACARTEPRAAAAASWRLWLAEDRRAWHGLASDVLLRQCDPQVASDSVDTRRLDTGARARVAELFADTLAPHASTTALLRRLASDPSREVRIEAVASLLRHARRDDPGMPVDAAELREARARARARSRARFKAIRPRTERAK